MTGLKKKDDPERAGKIFGMTRTPGIHCNGFSVKNMENVIRPY
jgi:hypothetical protein